MAGRHYLPLTEEERRQMLTAVGAASIDELFADLSPALSMKGELKLPPPL